MNDFWSPEEQAQAEIDLHPMSNVEAEACLLGALMIDNRLATEAALRLAPGDFFEPLHGRIFAAVLRLLEKGMVATPVTLRPFFEVDPTMLALGGPGYLAGLTGSGAALIGARDFMNQIAELAGFRKAREALIAGIAQIDADPTQPLTDVISKVEAELWSTTARTDALQPRSVKSMIRSAIDRNEAIATAGEPIGARCRFVSDMDRIIGPAEPGTYIIIGGRPGQGKSTLIQSAALGYAANGHPVEYFHAEMTAEQMALRVTSDLSHAMGQPIAHKQLRKGGLDSAQLRTLELVEAQAEALPINFTPVGRCDVKRIEGLVARAKAKWARRGRDLEVVVVDYIQLLRASINGRQISDDTARVAAVSGALLDIAQRHKVCLFGLSQLNRAVEDRKDHRPQMSDLKQAGDLEQDADGVILVFREETYLLNEKPRQGDQNYEKLLAQWEIDYRAVRDKIELICGKNRHDEPVTRTARFYGANYAIRGGDFDEFDEAQSMLDLGGTL